VENFESLDGPWRLFFVVDRGRDEEEDEGGR
jgi:hypothetical protein